MNQMIATVVALAAIAGVTVYEGIRFGFWNDADPEELNHFAARIVRVPESFGNWTSSESKIDEAQLGPAGIRAYISRDYINSKTGAKANLFLVCGKTHPMAIHSPDQCYAAAGFKQGDTSRKYIHADGRTAELWEAHFTRELDLHEQALHICWGWAPDDSVWQAPTNPRPHFSNKNALYKIYVITRPGEQSDNKPTADAFLEEFLPVLDKSLFAPAEPEQTTVAQTTS
jgi:hypothetical protein